MKTGEHTHTHTHFAACEKLPGMFRTLTCELPPPSPCIPPGRSCVATGMDPETLTQRIKSQNYNVDREDDKNIRKGVPVLLWGVFLFLMRGKR